MLNTTLTLKFLYRMTPLCFVFRQLLSALSMQHQENFRLDLKEVRLFMIQR